MIPNPSAGDILRLDFMDEVGLSVDALAGALQVPTGRLTALFSGERPMDADLDLRLARYWGMSEGFFLGLQADYDLMERRRQLGADLQRITPRAA